MPVAEGRFAFAFPGAGVAPCGREIPFYQRHQECMGPFLLQGSRAAGSDLEAALLAGELAALDPLASELFGCAFGCGVQAVYLAAGLQAHWVAGYSLGIYGALVAAGAVDFETGLRMVRRAHQLVNQDCAPGEAGLAAVVGLERGELVELLAQRPALRLVNRNSPQSWLVAGPAAPLEELLQAAVAQGALRALRLPVQAPYHHPELLGRAGERFRGWLRTLSWRPAARPLVSSIDLRCLREPAELADFTARNLCTPIHWQGVVERLAQLGATAVLECGPGLSLTQSARFVPGAPRHVNLRNCGRWLP